MTINITDDNDKNETENVKTNELDLPRKRSAENFTFQLFQVKKWRGNSTKMEKYGIVKCGRKFFSSQQKGEMYNRKRNGKRWVFRLFKVKNA